MSNETNDELTWSHGAILHSMVLHLLTSEQMSCLRRCYGPVMHEGHTLLDTEPFDRETLEHKAAVAGHRQTRINDNLN